MPKIQHGDVEISYRQAGQGPDLVLIHGLAANQAFWHPHLIRALADDFRVTLFDLRGHGYSSMPSSGYCTASLAQDLTVLLDHLEIERPHLVAHSFGGAVALHHAIENPNRASSLTLLDTRIKALQPHQRMRDWPEWESAKKEFADHGMEVDENEDDIGLRVLEFAASPAWRANRELYAKKYGFVPFGGWTLSDRSAQRWIKLLHTTSARADFASVAGVTVERLPAVRCPVVGIYAEKSRCRATFDRLHEVFRDCRRVTVPGVGHFFPVTRPLATARMILPALHQLEGIVTREGQGAA
ncbi:MAG: alpha/beta hydrolase [Planctomycetota bacterium]